MNDEQMAKEWLELDGGRWPWHAEELSALLARRALEARKEALEEAAQAFEEEYSNHADPFKGIIQGLKAIRKQAAASKAAGGGQ